MDAAPAPSRPFLADCPTRAVIDLLTPTWTVVVLHALRSGPRRPAELRRLIGGISPKALHEALHRLQRQGLVGQRRVPAAPPRVDYRLTPLGRSLLGPVDALADWAAAHGDQIPDRG